MPLFSLSAIDLTVGTGTPLTSGRCVYAHYTGWTTDGKKFDSSRDTTTAGRVKDPINFPQGFRRVIAGWDEGIMLLNEGGKARRRVLKSGFNDGTNLEVLDGLKPSEDVLVVGTATLTDGQAVTLAK